MSVFPRAAAGILRSSALVLALAAAAPCGAPAAGFMAGAAGGGGVGLVAGALMDARASQLDGLGSSAPGSMGSSRQDPACFTWRVGIFGEIEILKWLSLRLEPGFGVWNGRHVAVDDAGRPFDRFGIWFYGVDMPLLARFLIPLGPGSAIFSAGPFAAMAVGNITMVDQYADAAGLAVFPAEGNTEIFWGVAGGLGYSVQLPWGILSIELRVELAVFPAVVPGSQLGGEARFTRAILGASYGFRLGGRPP